jgi:hypothetical protein
MDETRVISSPPHREQEVIPEVPEEPPVPRGPVRGLQEGNETRVGDQAVREIVWRHQDGDPSGPLRDEELRE